MSSEAMKRYMSGETISEEYFSEAAEKVSREIDEEIYQAEAKQADSRQKRLRWLGKDMLRIFR